MAIQELDASPLPPSPFVRQFAEKLHYGRLDILDVGCCMGRNAIYLAQQGHTVIGVGDNVEELQVAQAHATGNVHFIAGDACRLPLRKQFDVVLFNEVLHLLDGYDSKGIIRALGALTKPDGFHVVSDYMGDKDNALDPFELRGLYSGGNWKILEYQEDPIGSIAVGDTSELTSLASIIAVKQ